MQPVTPPYSYSFQRTSSVGLSHVEEEDAARSVAAVKARREQIRARTVLALFSVSLLWCSSLSAADALVGAVLPKPHRLGSVVEIFNKSFVDVRRAEEEYAACAERQWRGCVKTIHASAVSDALRAREAESRNNATVKAAEVVAEKCIQMESSLVNLIRTARVAQPAAPIPWRVGKDGEPSCTEEMRAVVDAQLSSPGDALASTANDVSFAADSYRRENDAAIDQVLDLILARADYDAAYAANKSGVLAGVPGGIHMNMSVAASALAASVSRSLTEMDAGAGLALTTTAAEAVAALSIVRDETTDAVRNYVATVQSYVSEVTDKMVAAESWFSIFNGLGSVLSMIDIDVTPDVQPPATPVLDHTAVPGLPIDVATPSTALMAAAAVRVSVVSQAADAARVELVQAAGTIPEAAAAHLDAVGVPTLLTDYDPPPRNLTSNATTDGGKAAVVGYSSRVRADAKRRGGNFANHTAVVINSIKSSRMAAVNASEEAENVTSTAAEDTASAAAAAAADLRARLGEAGRVDTGAGWLGISPPNADAAETALTMLYAAMDGLVGADLAYRAARSAQHIARHFDHKGHTLPPIDLTAADGNTAARESTSAAVKIAQALGHPACLAAVRAVAVSLAATLVSYAYLPTHEAYRRGCVTGCEGTFVTLNMHSIAHNYAAASGARDLAAGVAQAEGERRDECASRVSVSTARLAAARAAVKKATSTATRAGQAVMGIVTCVDPNGYNASAAETNSMEEEDIGGFKHTHLSELHSLMRSEAWRGCTGDSAHVAENLGSSTSDPSSPPPAPPFEDGLDASAAFDCGTLPRCIPTCVGPSRRVLAPLAHTSGCSAEGLAHATALRTVLVGLVFFAANAARDAAVRGAAAVSWRTLSGGAGFRFEGTLRPDGAAVRPDTGGRGVRQTARGRLRHVQNVHERGGWWGLGLAAAAQIPGLVALFAARRSSLVTAVDCSIDSL